MTLWQKKIMAPQFDEKTKQLHKLFSEIRKVREDVKKSVASISANAALVLVTLEDLYLNASENFSDQWLVKLELLEIAVYLTKQGSTPALSDFTLRLNADLGQLVSQNPKLKTVITDGLSLVPGPF